MFPEWREYLMPHSVKYKKDMFLPKVLPVRQQETVPGPDQLTLLDVVEFKNLPPAFTVAKMPQGQGGKPLVTGMKTAFPRLAIPMGRGTYILSLGSWGFRDDGRCNSLVGHAVMAVEREQGALPGLPNARHEACRGMRPW